MKKIVVPVQGMHCSSCEMLLEKGISSIPNVSKANASQKIGEVEILYQDTPPDMAQIESIIEENGYHVGIDEKPSWLSSKPEDYLHAGIALLIIVLLYFSAKEYGFSFGGVSDVTSPSLAIIFIIGLTAGISSCMALIGGLVLGISAKWNKEHASSTITQKLVPHAFFHIGRILGFGIFGGILGYFGSIIHFSNIFLGIVTVLVGVVMLLLGFDLTKISPKLGSFSPKLPKFLGKNIGEGGDSKWSIIITGALTFFLPCGFTLAMQAYAVSTGSATLGALSLMLFALGTLPGLLSLGFITAILRGAWLKAFFAFTGVLVLILGAYNISNGYTLLSLSIDNTEKSITTESSQSNLPVQEIRMTQDDSGYSPNILSIDAGRRIRWIITSKSQFSCASQIMIPSLKITKNLVPGENVIEFIAPKSGEVSFSCSMGMYRGKFVVKNDQVGAVKQTTQTNPTHASAPRSMQGYSMMSGNQTR